MDKFFFRTIFLILIFWVAAVFSVAIIADAILPDQPGVLYTGAGLFKGVMQKAAVLLRWDAMHYLKIAYMGYPENHTDIRAFFPLYPLLVRFSAKILQSFFSNQLYPFVLSAYFLNITCLLGSVLMIQRMWQRDYASEGRRVIPAFFLIAWPWSFFYLSPYPEAFCLLLFCVSFEMSFQRRWFWAGAAAALASGTRLQGMFLFPALLIEYLSSIGWSFKKIRANMLWIFLAPAGFLSYAFYLGGIQKYFEYQQRWAVRKIGWNPLAAFQYYGEAVFQGTVGGKSIGMDEVFSYHGAFFTFLVVLASLVYFWKKWRPGVRAYLLISLLVPLFSSSIMALQRYILLLFPVSFAVCHFLSKRQYLLVFCVLVSGVFAGLWISFFVNGYFVS